MASGCSRVHGCRFDLFTVSYLGCFHHFGSYDNKGTFFVYEVKGYAPSWAEASSAVLDSAVCAGKEIRVRVRDVEPGATLLAKVFADPHWQARTADGRALQRVPSDLALVQVSVPRDASEIVFNYEEEADERAGALISLAASLGWLGTFVWEVWKGSG
jgi:hypothetical protein